MLSNLLNKFMQPSINTPNQGIFTRGEFKYKDYPETPSYTKILSVFFRNSHDISVATFNSIHTDEKAMLLDWYLTSAIKLNLDTLEVTLNNLETERIDLILTNNKMLFDVFNLKSYNVTLTNNIYNRVTSCYLSVPFCDLLNLPETNCDWLNSWKSEIFNFNVIPHNSYSNVDSLNQFIHWLKIKKRFTFT